MDMDGYIYHYPRGNYENQLDIAISASSFTKKARNVTEIAYHTYTV